MPEQETIDLTDGPNPIGTHLLRQLPEQSYVRCLFGLGNRENLVEPDAVHDPAPAVEQGDPFPYRASLFAGIDQARRDAQHMVAGADRLNEQLRRPMRAALYRAAGGRDPVVLQGLVGETPTGSINLQSRQQVEQ